MSLWLADSILVLVPIVLLYGQLTIDWWQERKQRPWRCRLCRLEVLPHWVFCPVCGEER